MPEKGRRMPLWLSHTMHEKNSPSSSSAQIPLPHFYLACLQPHMVFFYACSQYISSIYHFFKRKKKAFFKKMRSFYYFFFFFLIGRIWFFFFFPYFFKAVFLNDYYSVRYFLLISLLIIVSFHDPAYNSLFFLSFLVSFS